MGWLPGLNAVVKILERESPCFSLGGIFAAILLYYRAVYPPAHRLAPVYDKVFEVMSDLAGHILPV